MAKGDASEPARSRCLKQSERAERKADGPGMKIAGESPLTSELCFALRKDCIKGRVVNIHIHGSRLLYDTIGQVVH